MADLVSRQTGDWTTGSTWGVVAHSGGGFTNNTGTTTSYVYSPTFTIANGTVVDGVVLLVRRQAATGTFSVALSDDNGTTATREVTVNATDLHVTASYFWCYFRFGSTLTGDGGSDYRVGIKGSSSANIFVSRSSTSADWARRVVGTSTQVPVASDFLFVLGNRTGTGAANAVTVTMDETAATAYSGVNVSDSGTLTWDTTITTNLRVGTGAIFIGYNGLVNVGTSGSPVPRTVTALVEFTNASDGQSGILIQSGGVMAAYGESRTSAKDIVFCKLNTDEAAAQTVLGVDTDTGWKTGDDIAITSTSQTATQFELRTLQSDAGASSLTVTSGLTNAHSGTAPTQATVALLSRNVKFYSTSSSFMGYWTVESGGAFSGNWFETRYLGCTTSVASNKNCAIRYEDGGAHAIRYAAIRDAEGYGIAWVGTPVGFSFRDSVIYNPARIASGHSGLYVDTAASAYTLSNIAIIGGGISVSNGFNLKSTLTATLTNLTVSSMTLGTTGLAVWVDTDQISGAWTIDGLYIHSNNIGSGTGAAFTFQDPQNGPTIRNFSIWRNVGAGVTHDTSSTANVTWEDGQFFGNSIAALLFTGEPNAAAWTFKNVIIAGDTTHAQPRGIYVNADSGITAPDWLFEDVTFGVVTGIYAAHSTADITFAGTVPVHYVTWRMVNCSLASGTPITGLTTTSGSTYGGVARGSYISSQQHGQTLDHRVFTPLGNLAYEGTTVDTQPALKLTPLHATVKLTSNALTRARGFMVPVNQGFTRTVSVKVRKDGTYNGNAPRLVLKANPAVGVDDDVVLDTLSVGVNTWETLSGTTAAASVVGVFEFIVDCDGTAGNVYVDTWLLL
jgi:hypothetical protein